ncbi:sugar/pyridoxal phosphate phosphatase YigL [Candidatus Fukatsuia symbiotica]|uniref:Sugar/pyridoxal phosphate phosphatase YigL n=1 Tax=Candidatus Fukatsuia symbiotica TaxID=1878942 RepID=A0A2U8I2V5_9GAMM|nr:sugar/pyridoxal phosphate phosphatase YigL [Candidatus Fukatsuia symbiotica]AWK13443.1 sugar/pyridoxal phosphate phosphatase YigL [Candidatus Fukatsuia symbiotica]MEA9444335.1 sugar/pyridoxal phosphate phosphatase YigL [Candidatus Fukatsuia symbiotica]
MYHIVASDLDGTLLSPDHTLSPYARETLKSLTERGVHFVFATGRHHVDVSQIRARVAIDAFMITSNGARVHNTADKLIFSDNLDEDIVHDLYAMEYDNPDILTNVYRNDDWYINRESPEQAKFFHESIFNYQIVEIKSLPTDGVCKIYFISYNHEKLLPLEQEIKTRWGNRVNVCFSLPTCLEVMGAGVSKGHALQQVAQIFGHSLQNCIAFGDGMNDMEMLSMVGKGCIMKNAHARLKEALPALEIIGSNADDAVPHYLRKMFLV